MVKRGEIYQHAAYMYPAGNTVSKLIIVLNNPKLESDPIIVVPTNTNKNVPDYPEGCSERDLIFHIKGNKDFFQSNTFIQLSILNGSNPVSQNLFRTLNDRKIIKYKGKLKEDTLNRLIGCIKIKKEDIDQDIFALIFA